MTHNESIKILAVLTAAYPQVEIQEETIEIYTKFLLDLPYEAGQAAALEVIARSKWFPSIAELRQAAVGMLPKNDVPNSGEAWGEVVRQLHSVGYYGRPSFSHPAVAKAVKAIGWYELCVSENPTADRAHFLRIYEGYREREVNKALQPPEVEYLRAKMARELPCGQEEEEQEDFLSRILKNVEANYSRGDAGRGLEA